MARAYLSREALLAFFGLLCLVATSMYAWISAKEAAPPRFDFHGMVSIVSLRAANGNFLEVSTEDGVLRATAKTDEAIATHFRVHVLSAEAVAALKLAAKSAAPWAVGAGGMTTASKCQCSGFSNEHGFGRYCHPWETDMQSPWCYVDESCKGGTGGSFGRRHDDCALLNAPFAADSYQSNETRAPDGSDVPPMDYAQPAELKWVAPRGCTCSGVRSALGFGASCRGWEYEGQMPWCYVADNCSLASAAGSSGSFGHRYLDCVLESEGGGDSGRRLQQALPRRRRQTQPPPSQRHRQPTASAATPQAPFVWASKAEGGGVARTFPRRDPEEDALLESVERLQQPYVALASLATEGFVSVELPPHRLALRPHARTDALSLRGVFSFLRDGAVMAFSTNALFSLCDEASLGAGTTALDHVAAQDAASAGAGGGPTAVCTGFIEPGSGHLKLLRKAKDAADGHAAFKVRRHMRQKTQTPVGGAAPAVSRAAKPKAGKAKGKREGK
jgi:hypothetical protein